MRSYRQSFPIHTLEWNNDDMIRVAYSRKYALF